MLAAQKLTRDERRDRRRQLLRADLVAQLLPAVKDLLDSEGSYLALSVEQIISRADVARATFYRYFGDKNTLLIALSKTALVEVHKAMTGPLEMLPDISYAEFADAVHETINVYRPHLRLLSALVEVSAYDTSVKQLYLSGYEHGREALEAHITAGQRAGYVHLDIHAEETAGWITWMAERGMIQLGVAASDEKIRNLAESFSAIAWRALYQKKE